MKKKTSILLVDNDQDFLSALEVILRPLDLNVVTAESGEEALKFLVTENFAVIIMDVMMPRINGFETAALIRQKKKCCRTPLIFLTGFEPDHMRRLPGYANFSGHFLTKPIRVHVLKDKIVECLRFAEETDTTTV